MSQTRRLNVGCGRHCHTDWTNLDLVAHTPDVIKHDLRGGLPFADDSYDVVYHSHVLEHLTRGDAVALLAECRRVLRPGGVLRVVVPDLEQIVRQYLAALDRLDDGVPGAAADHRWMIVELLDQMVRVQSGGEMASLFADAQLANREFVAARMGLEMTCQPPPARNRQPLWKLQREIRRIITQVRRSAAMALVWLFEGQRGCVAYREAVFRQAGEVHRWMYDRASLGELLSTAGFSDVDVCTAEESRIERFVEFQLDVDTGRQRKPDSLYMEAIRPLVSVRQQRAA